MIKKILLGCIILIILSTGLLLLQNNTTSHLPKGQPTQPTTATSVTPESTKKTVGLPVPFPLNLPDGYHISGYASGLGSPRDLELTPQGNILVSVPVSNTVYFLQDPNHDGIAEKSVALIDENVVHGLAFHNGKLYVAERNSVKRYSFDEASGKATFEKKLLDLPGIQDHIYRTLLFGPDNKMYISVGSNCNVCLEPNPMNGSVVVANEDGSGARVFAKGLRNAPFLALNPMTSDIWVTEMGRDYLGDNTPPDEINILQNNGDYGWPICYGNKIHDTNFDKKQYIQDPCKGTIAPIYEIPAHSAPLGLAFIPSNFNPEWKGDLLVAYHGSWNRSTKTGYKVVHMKVNGNTITTVEDFITGFLDGGTVNARPVDLLFDMKGNLYISDDKSGNIFIVYK